MPLTVSTVTPPGTEPVTAAEVKENTRIDTSADDSLIDSLIVTARQWVETMLERALVTQTLKLQLDAFPGAGFDLSQAASVFDGHDAIQLPFPPLQQVNSVTYIDTDGDSQTFSDSDYDVDTDSEPGRLVLAEGESWPSTEEQVNAVAIEYDAGYGAAAAVPDAIKHAIKLHVELLYDRPIDKEAKELRRSRDDLLAAYVMRTVR